MLSIEYLMVAKAFGLGRSDLIELCGQAVEAVFGDGKEKERVWGLVGDAREKEMDGG